MDAHGLSLYNNVGTSLDLDALAIRARNNDTSSHRDDEEDNDEAEEEEIQQRNAELQDLLTNAFDDLIDDDDSDVGNTGHNDRSVESLSQDNQLLQNGNKAAYSPTTTSDIYQDYAGNSLYSPIAQTPQESRDTQFHNGSNNSNASNVSLVNSWSQQNNHKKNCVRFNPVEEVETYSDVWNQNSAKQMKSEQHYLASGLNSPAEFEALYAARDSEVRKLKSENQYLQHRIALLEGEKTGMKVTLETSDSILSQTRDENERLKSNIREKTENIHKLLEANKELTTKLQAAENNAISLERQVLDLNLIQANHRDANRQEVLLNGIKARYENDLRMLRDELHRLRSELDSKNESISVLEQKLRDVTEMHERTLTERAANLQEFNHALDQQRQLREQRDTLTNSTLLDQLSKAQEEIRRLRSGHYPEDMSDSMAQLDIPHLQRIGNAKCTDSHQTNRIISSLEIRCQNSEKTVRQLEEEVHLLQIEKENLKSKVPKLLEMVSNHSSEAEKLLKELTNVKELYLSVCREKDALEDQLEKRTTDAAELHKENKHLLKEMEEMTINMEKNLNQHKAMLEANWDSKLQTVVHEEIARARLEWLKETTNGQIGELAHVEKSLGEIQGLREAMDALRHERDTLQNELLKRQQQLKLERHLLREKFAVEKEVLVKSWQEKVATASVAALERSGKQPSNNSLLTATADAMTRLRQQCEEEKLAIITSYEKQMLDIQSKSSTPLNSKLPSSTDCNIQLDWKLGLCRVRMNLKNNQNVSPDTLLTLDNAIEHLEAAWLRNKKDMQQRVEKYRLLKQRVRDYQKCVNDKLTRYKADRQRSENYCRSVITDLLGKVSNELQQLEHDRRSAAVKVATGLLLTGNAHVHSTPVTTEHDRPPDFGATMSKNIRELQQQVHQYCNDLTNFSRIPK